MIRKLRPSFSLFILFAAVGARAQLPTFPNNLILAEAQVPPTPASKPADDYACERAHLFKDFFAANPDRIWSPHISPATRQAVRDFQSRKRLGAPAFLTYGQSVRHLNLALESPDGIDSTLRAKAFARFDDCVRDPKTKQCKSGKDGRPIPMTVYIHPDGGMIRVKPRGNPTDRFRPQPDVVIAVRYPYDADYQDFDKEGFKIDAEGRALPKWPKDLYNPYEGTPRGAAYADGWGDAAHIPIAPEI